MAEAKRLRYVSDTLPGIRRKRAGRAFTYVAKNGRPLRAPHEIERIRSLAIPPAWTDVWISPFAHGHIQATGRDARGRKQYRYHPRWRAARDETKYAKLASFAAALPRIRSQVRADLRLQGLPREKVLAIIVRLLETTFIRVGNLEYARTNDSFGLTTMRDRHARDLKGRVRLDFRGKGGKAHAIDIDDRWLAALVKRCRDLTGQHLFQYVDDSGAPQPVDSGDVNTYMREITGADFTAKDFRTWGGTLMAAKLIPVVLPERDAKGSLAAAIDEVADSLGNTPTICRKCYVHPLVLDAFIEPEAHRAWCAARSRPTSTRGLKVEERLLQRYLRTER